MLILVAYDVNLEAEDGKRRLRWVAKQCQNFGQRVQNSVFECQVDAVQYKTLKHKLSKIIDHKVDTVRFYNLGNSYENKIEYIGMQTSFDITKTLII